MPRNVLIVVVLLALFVAGCGSGSSDSTTSSEAFRIPNNKPPIRYAKEMHPDASGLVGPELKPVIPNTPPPESLAMTDLIGGIGPIAKVGDKVTIQYVGYDYETGKKFVSSWDQGKPFTFTLGKGEVIPAWEEGIPEMEIGDRREMVVPPELAEGPYPPGIPKGKTVVFVVETLPKKSKSKPKPAEKPRSTVKAPKKSEPKITVPKGSPPKQLETKELEAGKGPAAQAGDEVAVQYVGAVYKTGKVFESSWGRPEPFTFVLGSQSVIPGWEKGLVGVKVGSRRQLIIPPALAYGDQGSGSIPPESTLIFVIDVEGIK